MSAGWICTLLLLMGLPALAQTHRPVRAVPVREADAVCGECHREILSDYLKTPMANASGAAGERLMPGSYQDAASGVHYAVSRDGEDALLQYAAGGEAAAGQKTAVAGTERLRYFLGSGHIGLTYLYEKNGYWFESPVAYYEKTRGYAMKPGVEGMHAMPPALPLNPSCLRCHMSGVREQVAGTHNLYREEPFAQVGIACEGCHGDAREHVASKGKAAIVNPVKLTPERRDSTCIACHLEGDSSVEKKGHPVLEYTPGEDIRERISYFVTAGEMTTKRAVSEIEQFETSRCKLKTGPTMSCMNCHDPHRTIPEAEKVGFYRAKCLGCHTGQGFVAETHFGGNPDCTGCHMPKTGSENIAHVAWTDHRIRRRPEALTTADAGGESELVSLLKGPVKARDLGLAYYNLAADGKPWARAKALQLLTVAERADPTDVAVERSLGILAEMEGQGARAAMRYRAALTLAPEDYVAGTNLGTLLAQAGDLESAAALWQTAFASNQDIPELGQNLAVVECGLGHKEKARDALSAVLLYSPGLTGPRRLLGEIDRGERRCEAQSALTLKALP